MAQSIQILGHLEKVNLAKPLLSFNTLKIAVASASFGEVNETKKTKSKLFYSKSPLQGASRTKPWLLHL